MSRPTRVEALPLVGPLGRQFLVSGCVGVAAGSAAIVFYLLLQVVSGYLQHSVIGYAAPEALGEPPVFGFALAPYRPWLMIVVPALGALVSGLIVARFAPEASGHGTDAAIRAYHWGGGKINANVPPVKALSAALTIGSGGSGGREGPIAQIGAGIGYWLARRLGLSRAESRIYMAAGMAAGVGAIFRAPLAGALFAGEILYSSADLEPEVLLPSIIASISGYSVFSAAFGADPLFRVPANLGFNSPLELVPYTILGLTATLVGLAYVRVFYGFHHWCQQQRLVPSWCMAAIGGLLTGIVAYHVPGAAATGYGGVQAALLGHVSAMHLLELALLRIATTTFSIGSGGSGGVFGPSIVLGGCLGGAVGLMCHGLWPALVPQPAAFVVVGMAGLFGGVARAPISTIIMVSEMTGNYRLLVPSMWVCAITFMLFRGGSLYREQVHHRGASGAHRGEHAKEFLASLPVGEFVTVDYPTLAAHSTLAAARTSVRGVMRHCFPVIDVAGRPVGVLSFTRLRARGASEPVLDESLPLAELPLDAPEIIDVNDSMLDAAVLLSSSTVDLLVVVDAAAGGALRGVLTRHALVEAHAREVAALGDEN